GHDVTMPEAGYQGDYLKEMASEILNEEGGDRFVGLPRTDSLRELGQVGLARTLAAIKTDLELLGVGYDEWFSEQALLDEGDFDAAMQLLEKEGYLVDREGARWFASTQLGEEKDNVVIRSGDGGPTYFGTDIAYHYNKFMRRGFDRVIDVWGADHHGHVARMKAVAGAFGVDPDRLTVILNQLVSFKAGDDSVRFSKRKGDVITLRDLVDEVGADACRYTFLSRSTESQMEFDLELAKRQSSENPVYYVQYAHARLCSILRTAAERGLSFEDGDVGLLGQPQEFELIRELIALPEVVHSAARWLEPHRLAHYAMDLARALQRYYEECRVVSSTPGEEPLSKARLKLVDAARIALARTLSLMGMSAPETM
ncbi:MAG: arginine--tRNA ligase, partial [Chloroflexi bacterium]|nr:arginine--tRNA ligase [Chloroflexota bacterium]